MDSLLRALNSFSLNIKNDSDFDDLISKMEDIHTDDANEEWDIVTHNYSKLRYLDQLIKLYDFPETCKFVKILHLVLSDIDKKNQYYLRELVWESDTYHEEYAQIQDFIEKSLNENNPFEKIKHILQAYSLFIPIIEDYRSERFVDCVQDQDFIEKVESVAKRRKLN